ncbi:hypothetical protein CU097_001959, partial [Rhizopus azygosporus]
AADQHQEHQSIQMVIDDSKNVYIGGMDLDEVELDTISAVRSNTAVSFEQNEAQYAEFVEEELVEEEEEIEEEEGNIDYDEWIGEEEYPQALYLR